MPISAQTTAISLFVPLNI